MNNTASTSRRKLLQAAGTVALAVPGTSMLAACATAEENTGAEGTQSAANPLGVAEDAPLDVVIFKGGYSDEYAKYHESLYAEKFPKAQIKHAGITEIQTELQPRFVAGNPPDVIDNSGAKKMAMGTLVSEGQLTDLADLLKAPSIDDPNVTVGDSLLTGALDPVTFDGKIFAIPYVFTVHGFWYSKSLFAKHGWTWPSTWDGLVKLADDIKKAGLAPFAYGGTKAPDYFFSPLMALAAKEGGPDVLTAIDNLQPGAWKATAVKAAAEAIAGLAKAGHFLKGSEGLDHIQAQTAWVQGQAAIYHAGSFIENEMKTMTPPGFDMTFGVVPPLSTSGKVPATALHASAGENFIVPAKAHNARGGLEYLRVMLSKKAAARFTELTKAITIVKDASGGKDFGSTALGTSSKAVAAAGKDLFSWRFAGWYADMNTTMKSEMANLLAGRTDANGFVTKMQAKADAIAADSTIKKFKR